MEDKIRITTETGSRLVGALIGLVRATDGMVHVTDDTNNIIIEGLHMSDIALRISDADLEALIARAHTDKHTIVPDCSVCGAPCGRTADYDWESVYREERTEHEEGNSDGNVAFCHIGRADRHTFHTSEDIPQSDLRGDQRR